MTPLIGPRPDQPRVFAVAQGPISLHQLGSPTSGFVHDGCRLEEDLCYSFTDSNEHVTLVIDSHHAGFPTADAIQEAINEGNGRSDTAGTESRISWGNIAQAIDPINVRVKIPTPYFNAQEDHRVKFIAQLLDTPVAIQPNDARVVVNPRNGVIVVGEKVMVGRVAVTHKNFAIQTGADPVDGPLVIVDQSIKTSTTRLEALVHALNALKASPQDIIDIIQSLERSGDLYGRLIVE
jgi:flagellar P-ring protein precursor FlgI